VFNPFIPVWRSYIPRKSPFIVRPPRGDIDLPALFRKPGNKPEGKHFINVFTWPAESRTTGTTKTMTRQSYQLLHWVDSDINYWAVSDVSDNELQAFRQLFEKQLPHR
jgi:hypothetical protein